MLIILIMNSTFSAVLCGLKKNFLYQDKFLDNSGYVLEVYHWIYLCISCYLSIMFSTSDNKADSFFGIVSDGKVYPASKNHFHEKVNNQCVE